jgi:hypothetical protein
LCLFVCLFVCLFKSQQHSDVETAGCFKNVSENLNTMLETIIVAREDIWCKM